MDDALAALLVASPGSGPPGSPNLSPRFSATPLDKRDAAPGVIRAAPFTPQGIGSISVPLKK
jgi:hypothetical protein